MALVGRAELETTRAGDVTVLTDPTQAIHSAMTRSRRYALRSERVPDAFPGLMSPEFRTK